MQYLLGVCRDDNSTPCRRYYCNACNCYEKDCLSCDNAMSGGEIPTDKIICSLDNNIHSDEDVCDKWENKDYPNA